MKAAVISSPRHIALREVPVPIPGAGEVLVRVEFCGLSGADLRGYRGDHPATVYPIIPGCEAAGVVEELGSDVSELKLGQRVAIEPLRICGTCAACRIGRYNCCSQLRFLGIHTDGAMAEFVAVSAGMSHAIPDDLPSATAVLCEPFSLGVQTQERAQVGSGDEVVVLGGGAIGLAAMLIARAEGARVLLAEASAYRRHLAHQLGADAVCTGDTGAIQKAVSEFTRGEGARVVVDATGVPVTMAVVTSLAGPAGRIAILGLTKEPVGFSAFDMVMKELDLYGVRNCTGVFPKAIDFVAANQGTVGHLINGVQPLSQVAEAFHLADEQGTGILRIVADISG